MSSGITLPFDQAFALARQVADALRPHVVRVKAAGSLRRQRRHVGDIEFVIEPPLVQVDLFGSKAPVVAPIRAALEQLGTWVKGAERMMQITDVLGCRGMKCEVYLVHPPAQWGVILAIRTGPSDLGQHAVTVMRKRGFRCEDGRVIRTATGETVDTPDEKSFFACAGLPEVPPIRRDDLIAGLQAGKPIGAALTHT